MQSGLLPDVAVGGGAGMPGCFTHLKGIHTTTAQLWWWETIMTFFLVMVRYLIFLDVHMRTRLSSRM